MKLQDDMERMIFAATWAAASLEYEGTVGPGTYTKPGHLCDHCYSPSVWAVEAYREQVAKHGPGMR